jgi:hypothetical protein
MCTISNAYFHRPPEPRVKRASLNTPFNHRKHHMDLRKNLDMAQTIENSLVVGDALGSNAAWDYLIDHAVPRPLILRVLASTTRRRQMVTEVEPVST